MNILTIEKNKLLSIKKKFTDLIPLLIFISLSLISIYNFLYYLDNKMGLYYNDARSHLDIGRRVVENLKPGLAQLGSVWLPLPHLLMVPTIWMDFMWHSGLSGALISMLSYVTTGIVIYYFLKKLKVNWTGRVAGVAVFALNLNILYLQSTAMTELLLICFMTLGSYELLRWFTDKKLINLIYCAFFIMASTLIRYDGWFLLIVAAGLIFIQSARKKGLKNTEGIVIFFLTLASFGIFLWVLWNVIIFHDALYFIFGPYSAHTQQAELEKAGVLATKGNLMFSLKIYWYALLYNSITLNVLVALMGYYLFFIDSKVSFEKKLASIALIAPFMFNIIALYLGHSVIFIQGLSGNTWFNVRYGIMLMPAIGVFTGYLIHKSRVYKYLIISLLIFTSIFAYLNRDIVTLDDARVGASGKNVSEVSSWIRNNALDQKGFILISAASHDAIIFSSGLPMKRFIHEGTGLYWDLATTRPEKWARWIILRTNDNSDQTFKLLNKINGLKYYNLINHYPFADIYEIKNEYLPYIQMEPAIRNP